MSEEANIDAYFERIGFAGSIAPTLQTLEALHLAHVAAIPFENIDPLLGIPVRLELSNLQQKLLFERRGGYCVEQNLLFKAVLETLGFAVRGLGAKVLSGLPDGAEPVMNHMLLAVDVGGVTHLCDVGFGGSTLTGPIKLRADVEQETPHEGVRLLGGEPEWRLETRIGEDWQALYAFELVERTFEDFQAINDAASAAPLFRDNLLVARAERGQRLALRNSKLNIHPVGGATEGRMLGSVDEIKETLTSHFGITLPQSDKLDPALERVLLERHDLMAPVHVDPKKVHEFKTKEAFYHWLSKNWDQEDEVWIKIHKVASGKRSITPAEAIDVELCWGWVDGIRKGLDETSFLQRYCPRRPKSVWSQINVENVARLTKEGLMQPSGQAQVDMAKADGRWAKAYSVSKTEIPEDLLAAIEAEPKAAEFYQTLSAQNRFALSFRTMNMKTPAGRAKKIAGFVEMLKRGETIYPNGKGARK